MERFVSFVLYLVIFGLCMIPAGLATKAKSKFKFIIFGTLSLLVIVVFAGIRSEEIGTDVLAYAKPSLENAYRFRSFIDFYTAYHLEIGFSFVVYLVSRVKGSINVLLLFIALLQALPIYLVATKLRNKYPFWIFIMMYLLTFFADGFNIMRQSVAEGWLLLCFVYIFDKKWIKGILFFLLAQSFHSIAIIGFILIVIVKLMSKCKNNYLRICCSAITIFAICILLLNYENIIYFGVNAGFLSDRIEGYIDIFKGTNIGTKGYMFELTTEHYFYFFVKLFFLAMIIVLAIQRKNLTGLEYSAVMLSCMGIVLYSFFFLFFKSIYGYRLSYYMEYYYIILFPILNSKQSKKEHKRAKVFSLDYFQWQSVLMGLFFFFFTYYFAGFDAIFPYYLA